MRVKITMHVEIDDPKCFAEDWGDGESVDRASMEQAVMSCLDEQAGNCDLTVEKMFASP